MKFSELIKGDVVVFRLSEKMMSCNDAFPLMERLKEFINQGKKHYIMDFSEVPWMNSQGIAMIIWAMTSTKNAGGSIAFCGFSESTKNLLDITRLDTLLSIHQNLDDALKSLHGGT